MTGSPVPIAPEGAGAGAGTWVRPGGALARPWDALRREVDRCRRYGHRLALVQIVPDPDGSGGEGLLARLRLRRSGAAHAETIAVLRSLLRAGDEVWTARDCIFVLLPEADTVHAAGLIGRLRSHAPHLVAGADVRTAAFPDDGLTTGALVSALGPPRRSRTPLPTRRPARARATIRPRPEDDVQLGLR